MSSIGIVIGIGVLLEYVISEYVYIYIAWDMLEHHRRGTCLKDTGILVDMHMPHIYIYTVVYI